MIEGESFGNKQRYTKPQLRQQTIAWRKSWAKLVNRHLKRYGHKAAIDERTLKAQGSKRKPSRHRGPLPKAKRVQLNQLRARLPPQPKSPIVRISKTVTPTGAKTIRAAISRTQLAAIGNRTQSTAKPANKPKAGDWPPEAILDWKVWGKRCPDLFFAKWPQLKPANYQPIGGPNG